MKPKINSRNKGAGGEREFAKAIHDELGVSLSRNLEQSRNGGHDLLVTNDDHPLAASLNRFAPEVKRYANATPALVQRWWQQAVRQAEAVGKWPLLAYRSDRCPWVIVLPMCAISRTYPLWPALELAVSLSVAAFAAVIREG